MKNFKIRSFINQGIELTSKSTKLELTWTKKKKNTNLGTLVNANVVILFFFFEAKSCKKRVIIMVCLDHGMATNNKALNYYCITILL